MSSQSQQQQQRPEWSGPADVFYNAKEARKYDSSSRMMDIQRDITERALELLRLNHHDNNNNDSEGDSVPPALILDIGCGSGLSGKVIEEHGHVWVGCDISRDMLNIAKERLRMHPNDEDDEEEEEDDDDDDNDHDEDDNDEDEDHIVDMSEDDTDNNKDEHNDHSLHSTTTANPKTTKTNKITSTRTRAGDVLQHDMGTGLPFRPATFDAVISISALQWLCYANTKSQNPRQRLTRFFASLYSVLKRGGRAVLQFYPASAEQAVLISEVATSVGFAGGVVIDYPNSAKAKKHYLVLSFPHAHAHAQHHASSNNNNNSATTGNKHKHNKNKSVMTTGKNPKVVRKHKGVKTKEWILHKKASQRKKLGDAVRPDSKYTGRRRPRKF